MTTFDYRRKLDFKDQMPALGAAAGAAVGVGAVVYYVARLFLQRVPLERKTVGETAVRTVPGE